MVYTERSDKCTSSKDTNDCANKSAASCNSKYQQQQQSSRFGNSNSSSNSSSSSSSSTSWSKKASDEEKWKYNQMVRDDRAKFNSLHHC